MAALNPVYAEIHRRYDRFFALFFTDSLLFISLPPFPSHSFCHRFIFPSPAPSTAVYHWRTVQSQPRPDSWLRERDGGYIASETICLENARENSILHFLEIFVLFYPIFSPLFTLNKYVFLTRYMYILTQEEFILYETKSSKILLRIINPWSNFRDLEAVARKPIRAKHPV